ncbi:MAG: putative lipid II flippase FtsW [Dehalococcoidia bacterium]|nr:putative lipid II flippase FtsW [Dehalococcoidia bacterium]
MVDYAGAACRRPPAEYDRALVWVTLLLLGLGLVMVYSASIAIAEARRASGGQATYYLARHATFAAASLLAALVAFQIPLRWWQRAAPWLFLCGVALLALVLVPGIGREVNGSQRWLSVAGLSVQPSELMKLFVVLYTADYTVRKAAHMASFRRAFLPMFVVMLLVAWLLLREPDFGTCVVITAIALGILFLGGMNWKLFAGLFALLAAGFVGLILASPYRLQRVIGFMDPWADPYGSGYQLSHALIAFGRGEWFGVGLGASVEKLFYLPEAHTDFLLAVIAEELGFAGVAAVIVAYAWVVARAFAIGRRAAALERCFPALVAQGIGLWIGAQAIVNIGANTGMLPTKGLTLPLVSFGGSALVAACCAIAVLARVDWENRQLMRGFAV